MPKRPNPMAVNKALTYTVEEAATALGVTTATVRNYVRRGLQIMSAQRPYLISGEAIREFLLSERATRKTPLKKNELFCPSCRAGRRPFGMMVDLVAMSGKSFRLVGFCSVCESMSQRMISARQVEDFEATFYITDQGSSEP